MKLTQLLSLFFLMGYSSITLAADSYRWLHVTIDTPWAIFIFLLPMVLIPVILMAVLYWKYAGKPSENHHVNMRKQNNNS